MDFSNLSNEALLKMRQPTNVVNSGKGLVGLSDDALLKMRKPPAISSSTEPPPIPQSEQFRPADILSGEAQPQEKGIMQNIGTDLSKRQQMGRDVMSHAKEQSGAETALQMAGKVGAGAITDVAGQAVKSAYGMLPEGVKEKVAGGFQKIMSSPVGKFGISMAQKGGENYSKWAEQNPRAARNIEATVDIGSIIPTTSAKAVVKGVGEATAIGPILKGALSPSNVKLAAIPDVIHKNATATIEAAKDSGITYTKNHAESLLNNLENMKQISTAGEKALSSRTVATIEEMKDSLLGPPLKNNAGKIVKDASGEVVRDAAKADTSLRNLYAYSQKFDEFHGEPSALTAKGLIRQALGDTSKVETGNPLDVGLLNKFNKQWGMYKTGEDAVDAAKLADINPARSRAAFLKIRNEPTFNSLSPEVRRLVIIASKGKASGKFLDAVGNIKNILGVKLGRHLPILAGAEAIISGHPGALAAIAGVAGAEKGGKLIQRGLGSDVLKQLSKEGK